MILFFNPFVKIKFIKLKKVESNTQTTLIVLSKRTAIFCLECFYYVNSETN